MYLFVHCHKVLQIKPYIALHCFRVRIRLTMLSQLVRRRQHALARCHGDHIKQPDAVLRVPLSRLHGALAHVVSDLQRTGQPLLPGVTTSTGSKTCGVVRPQKYFIHTRVHHGIKHSYSCYSSYPPVK